MGMGMIIESMSNNTRINIPSFIKEHLRSAEHSWSIGISGAIGEFMYDNDEDVDIQSDDAQICIQSPRGAMRILLSDDLRCLAYEEISSCTRSWSQNVVFCVPESRAKIEKNNVLTYMSEDVQSINESSREKHLFDLGVDSPYLQFCIRTSDEKFTRLLTDNCGRSIFESGNPVATRVLENSPSRVVISALGRVEIETKIPQSASDTLAGPHTHLLPALLKANKAPVVGIPEGYVEALSLYPQHPAFDKYGDQKNFQRSAHEHFQNLLSEIGDEQYCVEKNRVSSLIKEDRSEDDDVSDYLPVQRRALRIAQIQAPFLEK
ncbi:MAG: hypothetical protein ACI909_001899 [Planctomycetota bacterium]|jgi:hypothetical protein